MKPLTQLRSVKIHGKIVIIAHDAVKEETTIFYQHKPNERREPLIRPVLEGLCADLGIMYFGGGE